MNRAVHFLLWLCFLVLLPVTAFSQERLTITTYYPSPVGSYADLNTNQMKVGSAYAGFTGPGNGLVVQGRVGIGTSVPLSSLHVQRDAAGALGPIVTLYNSSGGAGAGAAIDFNGYNVGANASTARIQSIDDGNFSSHVTVQTKAPGAAANALTERLRVTSAGHVGIGTNAPANADGWEKVLDVYGAAHSKIIATANGPIETGVYSHTIGFYGSPAGGLIGTRSNHPLSFFTNASTKMTLAAGGNLGLGTTNPSASRLDILGAATVGVRYRRTDTRDARIMVGDTTKDWSMASGWSVAGDFSIIEEGVAGDRLYIKQGGNVGISTVNPDSTLHTVSTLAGALGSTIIAAGHIQNTGAGNWTNGLMVETANNGASAWLIGGVSGTGGARSIKFGVTSAGRLQATGLTGNAAFPLVRYDSGTGWFYYDTSSRRYKDNIQPLHDDFNKILQLEPRTFVYKSDGMKGIGYIAEDLDALGLKNLVVYNKESQPDSINYEKVSLYILEVVKTQQKEIDSLKQELAQIKAKLK